MRRQLLKVMYPVTMWFSRRRMRGKKQLLAVNANNYRPAVPVYDLPVELNNGRSLFLHQFAGKKILFANTASDCGYTAQYAELQQLYETFSDRLVVIGFPANDFKQQEKGSDEQIAQFCTVNFGVTFPLVKKSVVIHAADQHPVFRWLTDKQYNGWNDKQPGWNFAKYLVNEEGILTHYFEPAVSPLSKEVMQAVER